MPFLAVCLSQYVAHGVETPPAGSDGLSMTGLRVDGKR
eukprot:SAG22_NODE_21960_length_252_cov_1.019608_1_plen_37_part_10